MTLTPKQEKYVQGLIRGLSQRQAFIEAGYSTKNKSDNYIDKEASILRANRKISVRYEELMNEHKERALWTREKSEEKLIWLVNKAVSSIENQDQGYVRQGTSSALMQAIQELNKLNDLYPSDKLDITSHQMEVIIGEWDDDESSQD